MPELPEVQTVVDTLKRLVIGKTILSVEIYREKTILNDIKDFKAGIKDATINDITRKGKFIIFHLSHNNVIVSHLRMEGKFFYKEENFNVTKHDLVVFHFADSTALVYNDTRRFGIMKLLSEDNYLKLDPLSKVGPDPFEIEDDYYLFPYLKRKSLPIKTTLLDQSIMSGLGNIYVDEVLFECSIHPLTKARDITKAEAKKILVSSREILSKAIKLGGSTIKSYHPSEGIDGEFQINLKVYGHKDDKCVRCGHSLRKIFVGGRGTTYCPNCQKRVGAPFVLGITGKTATGKSTASKYFKDKGFIYLNADSVVDDLYLDKSFIKSLKKRFPQVIEGNKVNKTELRKLLTTDLKFKTRFEKFIHPEVFNKMEEEINKHHSGEYLVIEVPLLFETGFDNLSDMVLLLDSNDKNKKERISSRGIDPEAALKLNESFELNENKKKADFVIYNNNDLQYLYKELDIIYDKVKHH